MVSIHHVAHKILSYIPYVLVLIDLRYEGKKHIPPTLIGKLVNDRNWLPYVTIYLIGTMAMIETECYKLKLRYRPTITLASNIDNSKLTWS